MRTKLTSVFSFFIAVFVIIAMTNQSTAQVRVTLRVNTSTCLDTLHPGDIVQVRGESGTPTIPALTWDATSGVKCTNLGGDYWEASFQAAIGDQIRFKFWTGYSLSPEDGTDHWDGWEGPINAGAPSGDNRLLVVGNSDTTLNLQYYNGWENTVAQFWRPFQSKQDSIAIYFRVNMGGVNFDPATELVDVRGSSPLGEDNPWITIITLAQEVNSVNSGSFQSGVAYVPVDSVTVGGSLQEFKFVIQPENWESVSNRSFTFSSTNDTTINWYYFNDRPPTGPAVNADILFRLKLDALENAGLFDASLGDKVAVTGAKGWPPGDFDFDTEPTMLKMTYNSTLEEWNLVEPFTRFPGEVLTYKYYISWDTTRVDTTSPNFIPGLTLTDGWEEPGVTGGADRRYTYTDQSSQFPNGDFGQPQQFFNSLDPRGVITTPITINFAIDMTPAMDVNENPTNPLFVPGDSVYVQFDGCITSISQGLSMWGEDNRIVLEDLDGDLVYTGSWDLIPPSFYQFAYRIVYVSASGEIWNGSGSAIRGRRYYQYAHPSSVDGTNITWPASYDLVELPWMLDNLTIEDPPEFTPTGVDDLVLLPDQYFITQNYPNPFNPSTRITYNLPEHTNVKLQIYDITGRLVKVLSETEQDVGSHVVEWNGRDSFGNHVTSGIYFLKFNAGNYTNTVKMMLLK